MTEERYRTEVQTHGCEGGIIDIEVLLPLEDPRKYKKPVKPEPAPQERMPERTN